MPDNDQPPQSAGFLGGNLSPDDIKPKKEPAPPPAPAKPAAPTDAGAGFLGSAGTPPPPPPPAAPEPAAAPAAPEVPPAPAAEEPAPKPLQPSEPTLPAEPPQPMPEAAAPAIDFFTRAEELYDQGFLDSAITCFRRGLDKDPNNMVAINNLAMVFIEKERFEDSRIELERAIELGAGDPELWSNLGFVLRKVGKDLKAADAYEKYVNAVPDAEDAAPIRGWIEKVRATAAEAPQEEQPPAAPATPSPAPVAATAPGPAAPPVASADTATLFAKAEAAYEQEQFEESIRLYDQILTIELESAQALAGRGRAQAKAGLQEEALASLREATAIDPAIADNWYVMGFILRSLERDGDATEAYEKFLALDPEAENADKIRGWIEEVRASQPEEPVEEEGKLKIDKQPAWAAALEEPPPEYQNVGAPEIASDLEPPMAEEQPSFASAAPEVSEIPSTDAPPIPDDPEPPASSSFSVQGAEPQAVPSETNPIEEELNQISILLKDGDSASALSKAQELVGRQPELTEAKILIARCFGQRKEFPKALAILKNIVANKESGQAYFFMGRCQQEMNRNKDARESFQKCLDVTEDNDLRTRVREIITRMDQTDKGICGACGAKVPVQELEKVNGVLNCAECREKIEQSMGGVAQVATADKQAQQAAKERAMKKKAQPSKPSGSMAGKLVAALFVLLLLIGGGGAGLFFGAPATYETLRKQLPASLPLPSAIPDDPVGPIQPVPPIKNGENPDNGGITKADPNNPDQPDNGETNPVPTTDQFLIDSPPIGALVVGVEHQYQVHTTAAKDKKVEYDIAFSRTPVNKYTFDKKTGRLLWMPTPEDAAKGPITITFMSLAGKAKAPDQPFEVTFRTPVTSKALGPVAPVLPGEAIALACGDLTGDQKDDVLLAHGNYWQGELILYVGGNSSLQEAARMKLSGRPIAVGIGNFGDGKIKAAVVDGWNREVFMVQFEGGQLVRLPGSLKLPGTPSLAAFGNPDGEGPMGLAVLCPDQNALQVYDAINGNQLDQVRKITPPGPGLWKHLFLVDVLTNKKPWAEVALIRLGKTKPDLHLFDLAEGKEWIPISVGSGVVQAAAVGDVAGAPKPAIPDLALVTGNRSATLKAFPGQKSGQTLQDRALPLPGEEAVLTMAAADLDNNSADDLVLFFRNRLLIQFRNAQGQRLRLTEVKQSDPPALGPVAVGDFNHDRAQDILYLDRGGKLRLIFSNAVE